MNEFEFEEMMSAFLAKRGTKESIPEKLSFMAIQFERIAIALERIAERK